MGIVEPCKVAPAKYREARVAYDALVARLDAGLARALEFNGRSWFDRFVIEKGGAKSKSAGKKQASKIEA
jgi:hypothetical protein